MDALVKVPFQAVAVRYVHDAGTGEFLNIGVVVLCPSKGFADARFLQSWTRVTSAFPGADLVHLRRYRDALQGACTVWMARHAELFRTEDGVTALVRGVLPNESGVELSGVISGVTADPERTTRDLFERHVGRYAAREETASRTDDDVWKLFTQRLPDPQVVRKLQARELVSPEYPSFRLPLNHSWKNGMWNAIEPLSLDTSSVPWIQQKTASILNRVDLVRPREQDTAVTLVIGLPPNGASITARRAAEDGFRLLQHRLLGKVDVVLEKDTDKIAEKMVHDIQSHETDAG